MKTNQNFAENHFWRPLGLAKTLVCWTRFPTFVTLSFSMEKLIFWMFRNSIQKEHENPMKMNSKSEKKSFGQRIPLIFTMFAERVFHFAKVVFLHCETLLSAKRKTRSANQANTNEKGMQFYLFCKITYAFCLYLHGWLNAIPGFQKTGFPIGKRYFLQSGKRVQQTM